MFWVREARAAWSILTPHPIRFGALMWAGVLFLSATMACLPIPSKNSLSSSDSTSLSSVIYFSLLGALTAVLLSSVSKRSGFFLLFGSFSSSSLALLLFSSLE